MGVVSGRLWILPIAFAAQRCKALPCFSAKFLSFVVSEIMAMEHVRDHVYGIQWHPEAGSVGKTTLAPSSFDMILHDLAVSCRRNSSSSDEADNMVLYAFPLPDTSIFRSCRSASSASKDIG